ncbi:MAG: bifunctional 2-keto-4-hydroxyglutarate aldolase/2-keto-3-deoxy-6-phosphogluconate aldolase [Bacilli bacterium]|jgi:2-dehydro-3-deoxyphosphogluconate aldolase/(4S)-4-hydroxy-2-oxoglutarate aldolase
MKKYALIHKLITPGVVAVVRAENAQKALLIAEACIAGGIVAIEVTFTVDFAHQVIKQLKEKISNQAIIIGAGTVLDSETARMAILNGAEFIVSPSFDEQTARLCNRYQIPYLPGCLTPTEVVRAIEFGCDIIKVFPGSLGGPSYIKALKGPFPQVNFMPTGGVSLANAGEWIKNGCIAIGVGGELTAPSKVGDYAKVTQLAKEFIAVVKQAQN